MKYNETRLPSQKDGWRHLEIGETIRDFTAPLREPDEYACTHETWEKLQDAADRSHPQGTCGSIIDKAFGIPVKVFSTTSECINYITVGKISGRTIQLLR